MPDGPLSRTDQVLDSDRVLAQNATAKGHSVLKRQENPAKQRVGKRVGSAWFYDDSDGGGAEKVLPEISKFLHKAKKVRDVTMEPPNFVDEIVGVNSWPGLLLKMRSYDEIATIRLFSHGSSGGDVMIGKSDFVFYICSIV